MQKKKKFKIVSLGCRSNQYEAEAYRKQLLEGGYEPAEEDGEVDICVLNSCTVTQEADKESRSIVKKMAKRFPQAEIYVTGCALDNAPEDFLQLPGVRHIARNREKNLLLKPLFDEESFPEFSIERFEAHTRAFVKIQDGCNSFCSYCIIPYVRGRSRSKNVSQIVEEVRQLVKNGYKEVVLTGINIGDFDGGEEKSSLADLVSVLDKIEGLERLRISSIDPDEVDDALIDVLATSRTTCHSIHLVLQSASNFILKRMNRKYTRQIFWDTAARLCEKMPDFTFTTDVIVGFPGETDLDFEETLSAVSEIGFAKVHVFPYSVRARTKAASFDGQLPRNVIVERRDRLLRTSEKAAFTLREKYVGREVSVLTENYQGEKASGHTDNFLLAQFVEENIPQNKIIPCRVISNTAEHLLVSIL